jgi:seryl-tRNA synthetase
MLDAKFILENPELVIEKTAQRGMKLDLTEFLDLSARRRAVLQEVENLRAEQNRTSKLIGRMKKEGKDGTESIKAMKQVSDAVKIQDEKLRETDEKLHAILLSIPNLAHESVPVGLSEKDNQEIRTFGTKSGFDFPARPHWEIGTDLDILDFERASKITGTRFAVYLGAGALMERALINFMLDIHTRERGYREVIPPFIANEVSLTGTGNLPKFEEDLFKLHGYSWYLIPTAEVPLTNFYRDEILDGSRLPQRFVAYTPCFRSEAGSYGKDIRGLVRQHQFNKVEMMSFVLPENSYAELEFMTGNAETVLQRLGLHYRVVALSTGDLGFAGAKTYDLELWMPHRNAWLEISSCTNCESFQARRANIRFKREPKAKPEFVHTLNGSGVAVGRTVSAILESYQQADGTVIVPEALRPYMNQMERITLT